MQGILKVRCTAPNKAASALAALAGGMALASCGLKPSRHAGQDGVRLSLIPAGLEPKGCWFEKGPEEGPTFRRLPCVAGEPPNPMPHISERRVRCRQLRKGQPSAAVEDRSRSRPSQLRHRRPDGLIRFCGYRKEG
jgi:hypothetical protein